ncbi:MAG: iron-sulfur cluster repair di-iron protein [Bacteroidetes bacterium]|nr:iron-sulfur cluster repair di-iron protein [Bacteroidota bacterium]
MKNFLESTLAELVSENTAAAGVFEKHGLDFCCKGKRTLENACQSQGLDAAAIAGEIEEVFSKPGAAAASHFQNMPLDELADYIVEQHHAYIRHVIPLLSAHTQKVAERHGGGNPSLVKIAELWQSVAEDMTAHMLKEEQILFPYIKRLVAAAETNNPALFPRQPFVSNPIRVMEQEHDAAGELMRQIRELSNDYTPPLVACTTYRLSFNELREFGEDLHRHVHLENNLLFPKAEELETDALAGLVLGEAAVGGN